MPDLSDLSAALARISDLNNHVNEMQKGNVERLIVWNPELHPAFTRPRVRVRCLDRDLGIYTEGNRRAYSLSEGK